MTIKNESPLLSRFRVGKSWLITLPMPARFCSFGEMLVAVCEMTEKQNINQKY